MNSVITVVATSSNFSMIHHSVHVCWLFTFLNHPWTFFFFSGDCTTFTLRLATKARSFSLGPLHPSFKIVKILREALREVLPENAHEIATGKLHISLTRVSDRENVVVSEYSSKEELIQVMQKTTFFHFIKIIPKNTSVQLFNMKCILKYLNRCSFRNKVQIRVIEYFHFR